MDLNKIFWNIYGKYAWDQLHLPVEQKVINTVVNLIKLQRKFAVEKILDAGCGTGKYALPLAEEGFHVTGIDYSTGMLEFARSKIAVELSERITFERMDMNSRLDFTDAEFDHVISISSLWAVSDPHYTLTEFSRILKPSGTFVVMQIPSPANNLFKVIKTRIKFLVNRTPLNMLLIAVKAILERTSATRYWTQDELLFLILGNKDFRVTYIDPGPPILIVATKK